MRKILFLIILVLLSTNIISASYKSLATVESSSEFPSAYPFVSVYPSTVSADVNETFTIAMIVYNLTDLRVPDPYSAMTIPLGNLYGFDIQFSWDPTVIGYVNQTNPAAGLLGDIDPSYVGYRHLNVTAPVEKYPDAIPPSPYAGSLYGFGSPKDVILIINCVNETGNMPYAVNPAVRAWFTVVTITPASVFNGNGTLFVMTFKVLRRGSCLLKIEHCTLADVDGNPIGRSPVGGDNGIWLNPPRDGMFRAPGTPTADFAYLPNPGVANKTMHLTANATTADNTTSIQTYMWNFGDGIHENTTVPMIDHVFAKANDTGYPVSLIAQDGNEATSANTTKTVSIATARNLRLTHIAAMPSTVMPNRTISIEAYVQNDGQYSFDFSETCNVTAYCNTSYFDPSNIAGTTWQQVGFNTTQIPQGASAMISLNFNSLLLPTLESRYFFLSNVTGIPEGYEANTTDNAKVSDQPLLYTNPVPEFLPSILPMLLMIASVSVLSFGKKRTKKQTRRSLKVRRPRRRMYATLLSIKRKIVTRVSCRIYNKRPRYLGLLSCSLNR